MSTVFPARSTGIDAARAIRDHLRLWLPVLPTSGDPGAGTYLQAEATARGVTAGRNRLLPSNIEAARVYEPRKADRPPFVRVVPARQDPAERDDDTVDVDFTIYVYSIVLGDVTQTTEDLISCFEAAIPACLEQQPVTGISELWWLGGGDGEETFDSEDERTRQGRVDAFQVRMDAALVTRGGPRSPDEAVGKDYVADEVDVELAPWGLDRESFNPGGD